MPRLATLVAPLALLCACAAEPPTAAPPPPTAAAPATPGGPPGDGRFTGRWTVQGDRTGQCNSPALPSTVLTLQGGQATLANPQLGISARGAVRPDGLFETSGSAPRLGPFAFRGRVEGGRAVGELASRDCVFAADLRRAG